MKRFYTNISHNVDVEIDMDDIRGFIDEMNLEQKEYIINYIQKTKNGKNDSLEDQEKMELLILASNKFSLVELESKIGNKFDLM